MAFKTRIKRLEAKRQGVLKSDIPPVDHLATRAHIIKTITEIAEGRGHLLPKRPDVTDPKLIACRERLMATFEQLRAEEAAIEELLKNG